MYNRRFDMEIKFMEARDEEPASMVQGEIG